MASKRTARSWNRRSDQLVDGPELEDPAVVHDRDPVAQDLGLLHVVGRQQAPCGPPTARSAMTSQSDRRAAGSIPVVGSSRKTSSGSLIEGEGDRQTLALAAREVLRPRSALLAEIHELDQVVGGARPCG